MKRKAKAAIMAATLTLGCANVLGSGALTASAQTASLNSYFSADTLTTLEDMGVDMDQLTAALQNTNSSDTINDYVCIYYPTTLLLNKTVQVVTNTVYTSAVTRYVIPTTSTSVIVGPNFDANQQYVEIDDEYLSVARELYVSGYFHPTSVDTYLFKELYSRDTSSTSTLSIFLASGIALTSNNKGYNATEAFSYDVVGLGDVNLNGTIDVLDAILTLRIIANDPDIVWTNERKQRGAADVSLDGNVTMADYNKIMSYLADSTATSFYP